MSWVCKTCSCNNDDANIRCDICDSEKPKAKTVCTLTAKRVLDLGLTGDVVVPEKFNVIGEGAFENMTHITSVTLHADVDKISERAFAGCVSLRRVYCAAELDYVGSRAFANCVSLPVEYRPKARRTASDAYATTPRPDAYLRARTAPSSSPSSPSPSSSSSSSSSSSYSRGSGSFTSGHYSSGFRIFSGLILAGLAITILVVLFIWLSHVLDWNGWQWATGITACIVIAGVMFALNGEFAFDASPYMSICVSAVFLINFILLLIFREDYKIISSILTAVGALCSVASAVYCFNDIEDGWGVLSIAAACLNVATFVGALIVL